MRWFLGSLMALAMFGAGFGMAAEGDKAVDLLAGDSLDGWNVFLVDSKIKKEDVWSVKDGVLVCKGEPLGYLYTKQPFKNFKLTLQWRWAGQGAGQQRRAVADRRRCGDVPAQVRRSAAEKRQRG